MREREPDRRVFAATAAAAAGESDTNDAAAVGSGCIA
jgi:hypothetical protein